MTGTPAIVASLAADLLAVDLPAVVAAVLAVVACG